MRWFSWLVEAFKHWIGRAQAPRGRRLSVIRPPSYHRPFHRQLLTASPPRAVEIWRPRTPSRSAHIPWAILSASSHILVLGVLATFVVSSPTRRHDLSIPVQVFPNGDSVIADLPSAPLVEEQKNQPPTPVVTADVAELRQFRESWAARADRLENRLLELTEAAATQQQTIKQQHRQMEASQQEATRLAEEIEQQTADEQRLKEQLTEEVERRKAEEQKLATQLTKEQEQRMRLEAEIAEQQRQYEQKLRASRESHNQLVADLQTEIARKDIAIHEFADQLSITIVDRVLFPSGQATLTPDGMKVLKKVGQVLARGVDRQIQIEGHTDNQDIGPELQKRFASNWELSTARATEVVRYLLAQTHLPAERLSAVGRADTAPVASNETEAGRQQNRRIEIILLPLDKLRKTERAAQVHSN